MKEPRNRGALSFALSSGAATGSAKSKMPLSATSILPFFVVSALLLAIAWAISHWSSFY
jgi:hypothetical protein